jgi:hypothetical protein
MMMGNVVNNSSNAAHPQTSNLNDGIFNELGLLNPMTLKITV